MITVSNKVSDNEVEVTPAMLAHWLGGTDDSTDIADRCGPVVDCATVSRSEVAAKGGVTR